MSFDFQSNLYFEPVFQNHNELLNNCTLLGTYSFFNTFMFCTKPLHYVTMCVKIYINKRGLGW